VVVAVLVAVGLAVLLSRRVSHDDVHSVEGYHRSLHTLESINAHPGVAGAGVDSVHGVKAAYPESAVRVAGTATVRVTDAPSSPLPPVPPPLGADPEKPVAFDDATPVVIPPAPPESGHRDKAMSAINHRPRRLAAPAMAVAGVTVLIVVLLVTGSHSVAPRHHGNTGSRVHSHTPTSTPHRKKAETTPGSTPNSTPGSSAPVTAPPTVSAPQSSTASAATYQVADAGFTLSLSATSGACWVDATNATSGAPYFVGTLEPGQPHSFTATSPVSVVIGAPTLLAATVDGAPVQLPPGFRTPFTMNFVAAAPAST